MWIFRAEELRNVTKDPRDKSGLMKNSVVTIKTSLENMSWLWKLFESSNLHIPKSIRLKRLNYPSGEIKKPRNGGLMVWKSFNLPQFPTWARISDSFSREIILTLRKIIRKRISSPSKIEFKRAKKFSQKCLNLKGRNTSLYLHQQIAFMQ